MSDAILLTAHGTVQRLEELPAFLARIRHGRPAPPALVAEIQRRYAAIGGSPLLEITQRQADALQQRLGLPVFLGMRLWRPELSTAIEQAAQAGVTRLCVLPLAPFSLHVYQRAAEDAARERELSIELVPVAPFGQSPGFIAAQVAQLEPYLRRTVTEEVVLTAHSLPNRVIALGDTYAEQVRAAARAIADSLGRPCSLAFQSQGADGGDWLGPELRETLQALRERGQSRVVVAPFGFLSDHVETLYDLDVEARAWAADLGLEFERVPALNTSPGLLDALEGACREALFG